MATPTWDDTEEIKQPAAAAPTWDETEEISAPKSEKSVGGFVSNAFSDAGDIIGGVGTLAGGLISHPIDTTKGVVKGIPNAVKQLAKDWGVPEAMEGRFADAIKQIGESAYNKPVSRALDVASIAVPALKGAGLIKGVEGAEMANRAAKLGSSADDLANIMRVKNLGARTKAFQELGEEEAVRLGGRAKEFGLTGGAKPSLAKNEGMLAETGADIGDMRHTGDLMKAAPTMEQINAAIEKQLRGEYSTGLKAGEGTEFNRAIEDVNKLTPKEPATLKKVEFGGQQMNFPDKQMDLLDRRSTQPELFPEGPTEGVTVPKTTEIPNPDFKAPGTSDFAQKSTQMNKWAENQKSLLRPSGAASDVANVVSGENDANLVHALGAEQGQHYVDTLSKHSDLETMNKMLSEKRARELGTSHAPGSIPAKALHFVQDRFGYRLAAGAMDTIASFLKQSPEKFGKYAEVLNHAIEGGPAALATTVDVLAQNDPAFRNQVENLHD